MICPHCGVGIRFEIAGSSQVYDDSPSRSQYGYDIAHGFCPQCSKLIVVLRHGHYWQANFNEPGSRELQTPDSQEIIYPHFGPPRPVEPEAPDLFRQEYIEAARVLPVSPKASAALSRRILQNVFHNECKIKAKTLADEIDNFINTTDVPSQLRDALDAVRNIGNFAAHPIKNNYSGVIVDLEPGEAEWSLDVLGALFDFVFVQPNRLQARKTSLNTKLAAAGKPPMK